MPEASRSPKRQEDGFTLEPSEGSSSANILTSAQGGPFQTSALQNCTIINVYCFEPLGLWPFVATAVRNSCLMEGHNFTCGEPGLGQDIKAQLQARCRLRLGEIWRNPFFSIAAMTFSGTCQSQCSKHTVAVLGVHTEPWDY